MSKKCHVTLWLTSESLPHVLFGDDSPLECHVLYEWPHNVVNFHQIKILMICSRPSNYNYKGTKTRFVILLSFVIIFVPGRRYLEVQESWQRPTIQTWAATQAATPTATPLWAVTFPDWPTWHRRSTGRRRQGLHRHRHPLRRQISRTPTPSRCSLVRFLGKYSNYGSGADAIKKFTPSLGIPYLGV